MRQSSSAAPVPPDISQSPPISAADITETPTLLPPARSSASRRPKSFPAARRRPLIRRSRESTRRDPQVSARRLHGHALSTPPRCKVQARKFISFSLSHAADSERRRQQRRWILVLDSSRLQFLTPTEIGSSRPCTSFSVDRSW